MPGVTFILFLPFLPFFRSENPLISLPINYGKTTVLWSKNNRFVVTGQQICGQKTTVLWSLLPR